MARYIGVSLTVIYTIIVFDTVVPSLKVINNIIVLDTVMTV